MPFPKRHRASKWSLLIITLTSLTALSITLHGYYHYARDLKDYWWHSLHLDTVGAFFSTATRPVSSLIPREFSFVYGGRTLYVFGRGAMTVVTPPGITSIHASDSVWPHIHFVTTMIVAGSTFFLAWLIGQAWIRRNRLTAQPLAEQIVDGNPS